MPKLGKDRNNKDIYRNGKAFLLPCKI